MLQCVYMRLILQPCGGSGPTGYPRKHSSYHNTSKPQVSAIAKGKTGVDALSTNLKMVPGSCHAPYSMARTLGDPSGQTVATKGRKVMVAWIGNGTFAAQSLPRDLSLSPADGSLRKASRRYFTPWKGAVTCKCNTTRDCAANCKYVTNHLGKPGSRSCSGSACLAPTPPPPQPPRRVE